MVARAVDESANTRNPTYTDKNNPVDNDSGILINEALKLSLYYKN